MKDVPTPTQAKRIAVLTAENDRLKVQERDLSERVAALTEQLAKAQQRIGRLETHLKDFHDLLDPPRLDDLACGDVVQFVPKIAVWLGHFYPYMLPVDSYAAEEIRMTLRCHARDYEEALADDPRLAPAALDLYRRYAMALDPVNVDPERYHGGRMFQPHPPWLRSDVPEHPKDAETHGVLIERSGRTAPP